MLENAQNEKKTILLVEDDSMLSRLYLQKFELEGFQVIVATNGEKALEMSQNSNFDIMLLDVGLPLKSGLDVLKEYRDIRQGATNPVIVLTNSANVNEKEKALALGAKEYLVKAMQTPEQVVEIVKKYL